MNNETDTLDAYLAGDPSVIFDDYIETLFESKEYVFVYLNNGVRIDGHIRNYDNKWIRLSKQLSHDNNDDMIVNLSHVCSLVKATQDKKRK